MSWTNNRELFLIEIFSEAGSYDRIVIQELLKEIAQTQQVDLSAKQRFKGEWGILAYGTFIDPVVSCDN